MKTLTERREQSAAHWLIENEEGLTPRQRVLFARWLADPQNARAYARLQRAWAKVGLIVPTRLRRVK